MCAQGTVPATCRIWVPCCAVGKPFLSQPGCALGEAPFPTSGRAGLAPCQHQPHWVTLSCPQPLPIAQAALQCILQDFSICSALPCSTARSTSRHRKWELMRRSPRLALPGRPLPSSVNLLLLWQPAPATQTWRWTLEPWLSLFLLPEYPKNYLILMHFLEFQ